MGDQLCPSPNGRAEKTISELVGHHITRLIEVSVHFDNSLPFAPQVAELVDKLAIAPEDWQTQPIVICPPGFAPIACCLLAELHGRMGYFPPIIRLRPVPGAVPVKFEVAEIIDLRQVRDQARHKVVGFRPSAT